MSYTVQQILTLALRQVGIGANGTTPTQSNLDNALMHLNLMLAEWRTTNLNVPCQITANYAFNGSKSVILVGPGGDINIPERPSDVASVFLRFYGSTNDDSNPQAQQFDNSLETNPENQFTNPMNNASMNSIDMPLKKINSLEEYSYITMKGITTGYASFFNYNPAFPYGELRLFPVSGYIAGSSINIVYDSILPSNFAITDSFILPPEYMAAIMWNLAYNMSIGYGIKDPSAIMQKAENSLDAIKSNNYKPINIVPRTNNLSWFSSQIIGSMYGLRR